MFFIFILPTYFLKSCPPGVFVENPAVMALCYSRCSRSKMFLACSFWRPSCRWSHRIENRRNVSIQHYVYVSFLKGSESNTNDVSNKHTWFRRFQSISIITRRGSVDATHLLLSIGIFKILFLKINMTIFGFNATNARIWLWCLKMLINITLCGTKLLDCSSFSQNISYTALTINEDITYMCSQTLQFQSVCFNSPNKLRIHI